MEVFSRKRSPGRAVKLPYGEGLTLQITEESRRGIKMDVVPAGVERIGEREGANEMRHGRAFREEENAFSRNARLGRVGMAAAAPRAFSLQFPEGSGIDILRQRSGN